MNALKDKVTLVTGGSRGIGRAIVNTFADEGAVVYFTYVGDVEHAAEVEAELAAKGHKAKSFLANAADLARAQEVVDEISGLHGRLDVVVNNAGITKDNLLLRMTEEQFDLVMEINLKSVFNYTKAASKIMMKNRSGAFINISSIVGEEGNAGQSNYAASKAGIIGFTKAIAQELASRNIRANAIAPGFIATEMTAAIPEEELKKWLTGIPLGRAGTPKEVADLCVFLASDASAYITRQVIRIDGGMR
jgi:3-oxoacyl-[acyl-carrier protein] reductase